jgi:hypothetical protein
LSDCPAEKPSRVWVEGNPPVAGSVFNPWTVEDERVVEDDPWGFA